MTEKAKTSEMDACINKYLEYKQKLDEYDKKLQKYRTKYKVIIEKSGDKKYISNVGTATINQANKNSFIKENGYRKLSRNMGQVLKNNDV